jgi:hypothetical protein
MANLVSTATRLFFSRPRRAFLILRLAWWVAILSVVVKVLSLPRALRFVSSSSLRSPAAYDDRQELISAIDALLDLNVLFLKPICWKRAAILHRYLGLRGIETTIKFGLRKGFAGPLTGHAWLEADGRPILETQLPDYAVTYVFPSSAPFEMELGQLANRRFEQRPLESCNNKT